MNLTRRRSQESLFRRWMPVTERNRHTVLATDPICPTIPNYASGTDIRYGSTHLVVRGIAQRFSPVSFRPPFRYPLYFINISKIALFCYVSIFRFGLFWQVYHVSNILQSYYFLLLSPNVPLRAKSKSFRHSKKHSNMTRARMFPDKTRNYF